MSSIMKYDYQKAIDLCIKEFNKRDIIIDDIKNFINENFIDGCERCKDNDVHTILNYLRAKARGDV